MDSHEIWVAAIFPESYDHYIDFHIDITAVNISGEYVYRIKFKMLTLFGRKRLG